MKTMTLALSLVLATTIGCGKDKAKAKTTPTDTSATTPTETKPDTKPAPAVVEDKQVSPSLAVSTDIATACGLKIPAAAATPKFETDEDALTPDDRAVLDQIATCLTTGALKGKTVALIGRADPRGTEEYNLGLGSRRAHSVSQYLGRLGVGAPQMAVTTRGALEASGTDESTWKQDRRVDIQLQST
ncbi:MAG: peptidoglycan-associated outer rane lipoprotein [Deltaproteobacteria bacterium]|nr:peptidoglycan-associated outer rane lipoprotein [Deltaproteobacteria bacterium]